MNFHLCIYYFIGCVGLFNVHRERMCECVNIVASVSWIMAIYLCLRGILNISQVKRTEMVTYFQQFQQLYAYSSHSAGVGLQRTNTSSSMHEGGI